MAPAMRPKLLSEIRLAGWGCDMVTVKHGNHQE
jgi:hypothetical protein